MNAWFISDIHIRDINDRRGFLFLKFLDRLLSDLPVTHLFLLGDIFDMWIGPSHYFSSKFQPIVDRISELKKRGVVIDWIEGNHDMHLKNFWEKELGVSVYTESHTVQLNDIVFRLEHGDMINPFDEPYIRYRSLIRSPIIEQLAQIVPGRAINKIGTYFSRKSRHKSSEFAEHYPDQIREMVHNYAHKIAEFENFDFIITGHVHVRDEYTFLSKNKKVTSINLGSWMDDKPSVLFFDGKHVRFVNAVAS
jgi:UDP-2,3-diacylglucosamine hydrolase